MQKKIIIKVLLIVLVWTQFITFNVEAYELVSASTQFDSDGYSEFRAESDSFSEDIKSNKQRIPNIGTISGSSNESSVTISVSNIGVDPLDSVTGTVTVNGVSKNFDMGKVWPGKETITVNLPMHSKKETISVTVRISDGGSVDYKYNTLTRQVACSLKWHPGGFLSSEDSLEAHYIKHRYQVGATNIVNYFNKAVGFSTNLKGATVSNVPGITPGVKRYRKLGKYIDIAPDKRIISFGT